MCVTATLLDGVVLARSACHHSVNYRSVVAHGRATVVEGPRGEAGCPGGTGAGDRPPDGSKGSRPPSEKELAAISVLRLPLLEVSAKVRTGDPRDDAKDLELGHWAGVVPLALTAAPARAAADLDPGVAVPDHVRDGASNRLRQD